MIHPIDCSCDDCARDGHSMRATIIAASALVILSLVSTIWGLIVLVRSII